MQALKVPLYPYHDIINYTNNLIEFMIATIICTLFLTRRGISQQHCEICSGDSGRPTATFGYNQVTNAAVVVRTRRLGSSSESAPSPVLRMRSENLEPDSSTNQKH